MSYQGYCVYPAKVAHNVVLKLVIPPCKWIMVEPFFKKYLRYTAMKTLGVMKEKL